MPVTPIFVIAQQRSGTNLLRKSLATLPEFRDLDEVFDPARKQYWHFRKGWLRRNPEAFLPTQENNLACFEEFLSSRSTGGHPFTIVDIKYNSTHLLNDLWHSPVTLPTLITWLITKRYPVIHLVRENHLQNYVSMVAGTISQQWTVSRSLKRRKESFRVHLEPSQTLKQIERRIRELKRFRHYLEQANSLEVVYQSLLDQQGRFQDATWERLCQHVSHQGGRKPHVTTQKTGRPLSELVANLETEIRPLLAEKGLEHLVAEPSTNGSLATGPVLDASKWEHGAAFSKIPRISPLPKSSRLAQPVFVIAMQRSGTNLLRKALTSSEYFQDLNEIFDPFFEEYWQHRNEQIRQKPALGIPNSRNQLEIFDSFLNSRLQKDSPYVLIDVKYNSTHHLNKVWHHPGSRPLLIDWLMEKQCPVIHLVRENVFQNYVSNVVAFESRTWLVDEQSDKSLFQTRLRVPETLRKIRIFTAQIELFRKWLQPTNCLELKYEDLVTETGQFSTEVQDKIARHVELPTALSLQIKTRKSPQPIDQVIANFDEEIKPALIEAGYRHWLSDTRAA